MTSLISQKEYLKKYLSGDVKKKKKKKVTGANVKRSVIVDDDIDLKSMRSLEDDEVELYQMDEDAPMIAGIVDERPPEVKAQEYYSSKRWKVFGGEDGVNVVDSMNKNQHDTGKAHKALNNLDETDSPSEEGNSHNKSKLDKKDTSRMFKKEALEKNKMTSNDNDFNTPQKDKKHLKNNRKQSNSDESPPRAEKGKPSHYDDSDMSPRRIRNRDSSSDSDASPPRRKYDKGDKHSDESKLRKDSRKKSPKHSSRYGERERGKVRNISHSNSPLRRDRTKKHKHKSDSEDSPPRREKNSYKEDKYDSDASPPRKKDKYKTYVKDSPSRMEKRYYKQEKSDSDASPPRRIGKYPDNKYGSRVRRGSPSDSDNSPPRKERRRSPKPQISRRRSSRSRTPPKKDKFNNSRKSYIDKPPRPSVSGTYERKDKRHASDSENSPQRKRGSSKGSDSDMSPPRNRQVNDRPLKKVLYKPNDDSSSDEGPKSKSKKMKTTLDGKQAGLQDAKQLKKELSDLKMKEDTMFSKMDASVSGVGAAPVKRDRKTGQIRDLEKEKEAQRQKEAKESVVNEKYYKWGKGIKQTEDAAVRAAEAVKEMNKPLARYVDDKDLDEFLKAQDREGDPMLEYIKRKQSESTPLQGENPIYKGSWNPNRFNIRPGYRWDGVVRSNGYEQEWFKTKNAKKARDEEAYKWSTSDM